MRIQKFRNRKPLHQVVQRQMKRQKRSHENHLAKRIRKMKRHCPMEVLLVQLAEYN
jgi:hypothetical protein